MDATEQPSAVAAPLPWQNEQWNRVSLQLEQDRLAHAYLLCGERGLGKLVFGRELARLLLCQRPQGGRPCGSCRSCELYGSGSNPDLAIIEPESGSGVLKIDQIRKLGEFAAATSHGGVRKVALVYPAEAMNINAANALLKTLEEPSGTTVLLLVSDSPGRLAATVRSRCQRLPFRTPERQVCLAWLAARTPAGTDLELLLSMAAGKPLLADQLAQAEHYQQRLATIGALAGILQGSIDPIEFAAQARVMDVAAFLEQLWRLTAELVKHLVGKAGGGIAERETFAFLAALERGRHAPDVLLGRLLQLNQLADEARLLVAGPSNPNKQLLLESVAWRWSRLLT